MVKKLKPGTSAPLKRSDTDKFHPVDVLVGQQVRAERKNNRLSQAKLGAALGLSFQQIQKYELGWNRISVSTLAEIAALLNVPIANFFSTLDVRLKEGDKRHHPYLDLQIYSALIDCKDEAYKRVILRSLAIKSNENDD